MKNFTATFSVIFWIMLSHQAFAAYEIRQEVYEFGHLTTRSVSCVTFVISESPTPNELPITCWLSIIPFELGSTVLSHAAGKAILADLRKCEILQTTPLTITGHACTLGAEKLNKILSLQRAEAVATLLQNHGFTVATTQGRGSQMPFTDEITELYKNRRVEITRKPEQK